MSNGKSVLYHSVTLALLALLIILNVSCSQYDYVSPSPGIIEIRLKTVSTHIPFLALNNFTLKVEAVEAIRANGTRVQIFEDLKAFQRTANLYNTLDFRARDSTLVIGEGYAPPDQYIGLNLTILPDTLVILNGYQVISVSLPEKFDPLLAISRNYSVNESRTTVVTITVDLDAALEKRFIDYLFHPSYYISSVQ